MSQCHFNDNDVEIWGVSNFETWTCQDMSRALFEISHDSSDSLRDDEDLENSRAKINIIGATRIYSTTEDEENSFAKHHQHRKHLRGHHHRFPAGSNKKLEVKSPSIQDLESRKSKKHGKSHPHHDCAKSRRSHSITTQQPGPEFDHLIKSILQIS